MSSLSFAAQVDSWVKETEQRMTAVFRESTQQVVAEAQMRVPVDTGFLRGSLQASRTAMPMINPAAKGGGRASAYQSSEIALIIAGAELGQTIYAGYTASYAAFVEYGTSRTPARGFVRLAAQRWPQIVAEVTERAKSRVRAN